MAGENVAVSVLAALGAIEPANALRLAHKVVAQGTFLASIELVYPDNNIVKCARLRITQKDRLDC